MKDIMLVSVGLKRVEGGSLDGSMEAQPILRSWEASVGGEDLNNIERTNGISVDVEKAQWVAF